MLFFWVKGQLPDSMLRSSLTKAALGGSRRENLFSSSKSVSAQHKIHSELSGVTWSMLKQEPLPLASGSRWGKEPCFKNFLLWKGYQRMHKGCSSSACLPDFFISSLKLQVHSPDKSLWGEGE